MNTKRLRLALDILMTLVSIILMGGAYLFPADIVHEILGVALFVLWAVHVVLNRRWYGAILRVRYNTHRILQTVINCCIFVCVILLMISGIILSNHIFTFLGIESGLGYARTAHLLASHWYYLFMSLHIGLHVEKILEKIRIISILISLYGIYAFIIRGIWRYLILQQQFFFLDLERRYFLFALDYISIIILFVTIIHYLNKLLPLLFDASNECQCVQSQE